MIDPTRIMRGALNEIAPGVWYLPVVMANVYLVGERNGPWVLVDAGLRGTGPRIRMAAAELFGDQAASAIVLTHGHFDHVGALPQLADDWNVPVFAHPLEMPFLDGRDDYPPPDPTVGGFMAQMSRVFPRSGINVGHRLRAFPMDTTIPYMPGWRTVHTPGHTAGHVSLFRDEDRTLIAGDAVITINQENAGKLLSQVREFRTPPKYFTSDWAAARNSVNKLVDLRPQIVAAGHGLPWSGAEVADELRRFADTFTPPPQGRYVQTPAVTDANGVVSVPPAPYDPVPKYAAGVAIGAVGLMMIGSMAKRKRPQLTFRG